MLLVLQVADELGRPLNHQRKNLLCLGYATGYRGEVLRRLNVESFIPRLLEGNKSYEIVVGTMKQHEAKFSTTDQKLFSLLITSSALPALCPVRAIDAPTSMLQRLQKPLQEGEDNFLFRMLRNTTQQVSPSPISDDFFRGLSMWVSSILERKVTFKDLARRTAISRWVNSGELPIAE